MTNKRFKLETFKKDKINKPVIVSFPQNIPSKAFLASGPNENSGQKLKFTLMNKNKKTIVIGENEIMEYKGKSFSADNLSKKQTSEYIVGILDHNNKVKLIDIDHFYTLTQHAKNAVPYKPVTENMFEGVEYFERKHELVNVFGTKKAQQKMRQLKSNVVEEDSINTAKQMNQILKKDVTKLQKEEQNKEEEVDPQEVLPGFNKDAVTPDEFYDRDLMIPKEINEFLNFKDLYKTVKNGKEINDELYTAYERTTIFAMKNWVEQERNNEKVKHLKYRVRASIYLTYLIRFYKLPKIIKSNTKEIEEYYGIPKNIADWMLNTYAELMVAKDDEHKRKFNYSKTKKLEDRLLCHFIILLLAIYDYQIDVKWIINALKIEFGKLVKYLRIISCTPKTFRKPKTHEDPTEEEEVNKRSKAEWALDNTGSLIVQLKVKTKRNKIEKE